MTDTVGQLPETPNSLQLGVLVTELLSIVGYLLETYVKIDQAGLFVGHWFQSVTIYCDSQAIWDVCHHLNDQQRCFQWLLECLSHTSIYDSDKDINVSFLRSLMGSFEDFLSPFLDEHSKRRRGKQHTEIGSA